MYIIKFVRKCNNKRATYLYIYLQSIKRTQFHSGFSRYYDLVNWKSNNYKYKKDSYSFRIINVVDQWYLFEVTNVVFNYRLKY